MSVQKTIREQYRTTVDRAASGISNVRTPSEGWIVTLRKVLGMSGAQLACRLESDTSSSFAKKCAKNRSESGVPTGMNMSESVPLLSIHRLTSMLSWYNYTLTIKIQMLRY